MPTLGIGRIVATTGVRRQEPLLLAVLLSLILTLALGGRAEAFIYWGDYASVHRANPNGTGFERSGRSFIHTRPQTCGVAVDAGHVYWSSDDRGIGRANLDGTGVDHRFITEAKEPWGIAVDAGHVYWASDRGTIGRANLDGTGADQRFITGLYGPNELAVDATGIYWADQSYGIGRANLDGSDVNRDFIAGPDEIYGVAVDANHVYWSNWGAPPNTIGRANLDGTGVDQRFITGRIFGPNSVAVDARHLYWADFDGGAIGRANLDGTGVKPRFVRTTFDQPCGLAVDALRSFHFVKVKRNKRRGTAVLTVKVPAAGRLRLKRTKRVRGARKRAESAGRVKLPIRPSRKGNVERQLSARGWSYVRPEVKYIPRSRNPNIVANTLSRGVTLVRRG